MMVNSTFIFPAVITPELSNAIPTYLLNIFTFKFNRHLKGDMSKTEVHKPGLPGALLISVYGNSKLSLAQVQHLGCIPNFSLFFHSLSNPFTKSVYSTCDIYTKSNHFLPPSLLTSPALT